MKFIAVLEIQRKDMFKDIQKEIGGNFFEIKNTGKEYEKDFIAAKEYRDRYSEIKIKTESLIEERKLPQMIIPEKRKLEL